MVIHLYSDQSVVSRWMWTYPVSFSIARRYISIKDFDHRNRKNSEPIVEERAIPNGGRLKVMQTESVLKVPLSAQYLYQWLVPQELSSRANARKTSKDQSSPEPGECPNVLPSHFCCHFHLFLMPIGSLHRRHNARQGFFGCLEGRVCE